MRDRMLFKLIAVGLVLAGAGGVARAQQSVSVAELQAEESQMDRETLERVKLALDRAMEYLARQQKPDGRWCDQAAANAVALLALLGRGHVPERGAYAPIVERGAAYLLSTQAADGNLGHQQQRPMYHHGLATLALAELYGMSDSLAVEDGLRKAIDLIVKAQSGNGGWRYNPRPGDHDLSVTIMQIVALRAANNAEMPVPSQTIDNAVAYVRSASHANGSFCYQPNNNPNPQMTAAGILALQLLGYYDDPRIAPALEVLAQAPAQWGAGGGVRFFFYFHYYAMQAQYQAGGKHWNKWHPGVRELLLDNQNPDGSWNVPPGIPEEANVGLVGPDRIYWTAMASLALDVYLHYLPAYQR